MTTIQVPLDKNPDVAALVADMQPGARVCGCFTIKSKDAQTLELRIEQMADSPSELKMEDDEEEDGETKDGEETEATDKTLEGVKTPAPDGPSRGKKMADSLNAGGDMGY